MGGRPFGSNEHVCSPVADSAVLAVALECPIGPISVTLTTKEGFRVRKSCLLAPTFRDMIEPESTSTVVIDGEG